MFSSLITFIRDKFPNSKQIQLHEPIFGLREIANVTEAINSTYVSSVGKFVDEFENNIANYCSSKGAVATVNGTAGLHVALKIAGVLPGEYVLTQALTFVATCNAISYCGATPVFIDVDEETLGMSAKSLKLWLEENAAIGDDGLTRHRIDRKIIRACLPMHTFGHPIDIDGVMTVCNIWNLSLIEDAAESLGSLYKGKHTGTYGKAGVLSFNGNKIITTGGGGMIISNDLDYLARAKQITTTSKKPHTFEFFHDEIAFNYRMPNLNAALGCAQLEKLERYIEAKRKLALDYQSELMNTTLKFIAEPKHCRSNYWLNAVICEDRSQRDALINETNSVNIATRPIWTLMHRLPMYKESPRGNLKISEWFEDRVVNLPSSVLADSI
jgi:aminotransferase in exopolysaccharide biosynthesis